MSRPILLSSEPWIDLPLEELALKASEWGALGLELSCGGDHCEVQRAGAGDDYCPKKLELLSRHDLIVPVLNNLRVGQAVGDRTSKVHQASLPDYVWGDGDPDGVPLRAAEEMVETVRIAQKLGASIVACATGSTLWPFAAGGPTLSHEMVQEGLRELVERWSPVLEACADCGIKLACLLGPGQAAFDLHSAEALLDVAGGNEELGFLLDPPLLHWQGVDPVELVRRLGARIHLVRLSDAAIRLDGRSGLLSGYWSAGDARRGWDRRTAGRGGIDWESLIRALNATGYDGPLSVDAADPGMSRDQSAEEALRFAKRLDFGPD